LFSFYRRSTIHKRISSIFHQAKGRFHRRHAIARRYIQKFSNDEPPLNHLTSFPTLPDKNINGIRISRVMRYFRPRICVSSLCVLEERLRSGTARKAENSRPHAWNGAIHGIYLQISSNQCNPDRMRLFPLSLSRYRALCYRQEFLCVVTF
jgi:hypothetical protein